VDWILEIALQREPRGQWPPILAFCSAPESSSSSRSCSDGSTCSSSCSRSAATLTVVTVHGRRRVGRDDRRPQLDAVRRRDAGDRRRPHLLPLHSRGLTLRAASASPPRFPVEILFAGAVFRRPHNVFIGSERPAEHIGGGSRRIPEEQLRLDQGI